MTHAPKMLYAIFMFALATSANGAVQAVPHGRVIYSKKFSEEPKSTGNSGIQTSPIAGIRCSRSYCDDKELILGAEGGIVGTSTAHKTARFSEENGGHARCPTGMVVNSIFCFDDYCDDMVLGCDRIVAPGYAVSRTNFYESSKSFSEEEKEGRCRDGYYLRGIKCFKSYCDNLKLDCVQITRDTSLGQWVQALERDFEREETAVFDIESEVVNGPVSAMECSHFANYDVCRRKKLIYLQAQCGASLGGDSIFNANGGSVIHCPVLSHLRLSTITQDKDYYKRCKCPKDQLMVGTTCSGNNCFGQYMRCRHMKEGFRINHNNVRTSNKVGGNGLVRCPSGTYAYGISSDLSSGSTSANNIFLTCVEVLWLAK